MYKIRLVLADFDSRYVDKVAEFISSNYPSRIKVSSFTRVDLLENFLNSTEDDMDILFAHPGFLNVLTGYYKKFNLIVALADNSLNCALGEWATINKYQPGDKLVSKLLDFYGEQNAQVSKLVHGGNGAKVVSVYSPAGGVGKTTIALGLAAELSDRGQSVLAISLESINSMIAGLNCLGNDAMTHLFLSLKENSTVLPLKIQTYKTRDALLNIDFIEPADCFLDQAGLSSKETGDFIQKLKQLGNYDFVVVDMDSTADEKAISVFGGSDKIILVQVDTDICRFKMARFLSQMEKTGIAEKIQFPDKLLPVTNKCIGVAGATAGLFEAEYTIPICQELWSCVNGRYHFDVTREFTENLDGVAKKLLNLAKTEGNKYVVYGN